MLKTIYLIFLGLASGCMVAAGTFAFIAAIGIVPRMAKRTETQRFIRIYEAAMRSARGFSWACSQWR